MITFINVFSVEPEKQQAAFEAVKKVYAEVVQHQPGLISAQVLKSDDGTRVTAVAYWESEEHLQSMRNTSEFQNLVNTHDFEAMVGSSDGHVYSTAAAFKK
jgi:heme-degrading monooxygenase HmoA